MVCKVCIYVGVAIGNSICCTRPDKLTIVKLTSLNGYTGVCVAKNILLHTKCRRRSHKFSSFLLYNE